MDNAIKEDLIGLTGYILEYEYKDMIEVLMSEPSYLEEGIITEAEIEELGNVSSIDSREEEIVIKCCLNPLNLHIYALAYRTWNNFLRENHEN